jgi:dTDP-4-amino-4,6-dideoxygalactose transaminase
MLLPDHAANWLRDAPGEVGAVMPVMPFGQPMNLPSWDAFRELTGIPVVVDAAAAFDTARASKTPAVVSLHATKILGIGEGGFVMSTDRNLLDEVRKRTNFGFWNSREAAVVGLNAKLSEYAAAVGLAALDEWPQTRAAFERVANRYREAFAMTGILLQPNYGNGWMSSTTVVQLPPRTLNFVKLALAHQGISFRLWWGGGLHRHAAFIGFPRTPLPITDVLVSSVIGLPCWVDLPDHTIFHIAEIATKAVQQGM